MVDTTMESSKKLVQGLREINSTTREMEQSRIEIQLKLFADNMAYKKDHNVRSMEYKMERDRHSFENMRLSLLN